LDKKFDNPAGMLTGGRKDYRKKVKILLKTACFLSIYGYFISPFGG
jgi:hypothetical protein